MDKFLIIGGSGFIGTNLIDDLLNKGCNLLNIDIASPNKSDHINFWRCVDILNYEALSLIINDYKPNFIIHLAARTDTTGNSLDDYEDNIIGTRNLISIIKNCSFIERFILTSTQFVNQYNGRPLSDTDYSPHTFYGQSKVINEIDLRAAKLECVWTIIRPTNIWGPFHPRYPFEFWKILSQKLYFHPNKKNIFRSYGYVKNVTFQIQRIFEANSKLINKNTFYVGDHPIDQYLWVNSFSQLLIGSPVKIIPKSALYLLALFGSTLRLLKVQFPITLSRYKSMTTSNDISMNKTYEILGIPPYTLLEGVSETVEWLKIDHPTLVTRHKHDN